MAAALTTSVVMEEPGKVTRTGGASGMAVATLDGSAPPGWVVGSFTDAGVPCVGVDDFRALRWSKLLLNMLGAPISAIVDCDMRTIAEHPGLFRLEQLALREAGRVMDAQDIRTIELPGYRIRAARILMRLPRFLAQRLIGPRMVRSRGGRAPGMRVDMARNRSEVAWFNGAVADAGNRLGVRTPVNSALTALTLDLVANPDRREVFRGHPEALIAWMRAHGVRI
jgi:2-dehydropantoate 2-reductase